MTDPLYGHLGGLLDPNISPCLSRQSTDCTQSTVYLTTGCHHVTAEKPEFLRAERFWGHTMEKRTGYWISPLVAAPVTLIHFIVVPGFLKEPENHSGGPP